MPTSSCLLSISYRLLGSILSIGTGLPSNDGGSVNLLRMLSEIIDLCTSSNNIHERVSQWIEMTNPKPNYFRFSPTNGEGMESHWVFWFQLRVTDTGVLGSFPLDTSDPATLESIERSTEAYMKTPAVREQVERLKRVLALTP